MLLSRHEINDKQWNNFVETSLQGSIYHYTWYLDVVCPNWSAIIVENKEHWNAVMPLPISQKMGIRYALQPQLTQYLGVLFRPQKGKQLTQWNNKKKWCEAVVQQIPKSIKFFKFTFAPQFDYPLPFHWAAYQLEVKYTYWLSLEPTAKQLIQGTDNSVRRLVQKAKKEEYVIHKSETIVDLIELSKVQKKFLTDKQYENLFKLWEVVKQENRGIVLKVYNKMGELQAGSLILKNRTSWIYLFAVSLNDKGKVNVSSFMLSEAIQMAKKAGVAYFDFEGSMIPGVERFFRNFGGNPVPYLFISKNTLPRPLKWLK